MIVLSSFRPLDQSAEYAENQRRAHASWLKAFDKVVYFNDYDERMAPVLDGRFPTEFAPIRNVRPTMAQLMRAAGAQQCWVALSNADIVVAKKFREVEKRLIELNAKCAMSRRFNFDPKNMKEPAKATDLGIDIFCAVPEVWQRAAAEIPEGYVLGKGQWDTWTLGFFMAHWPNDCYDFSKSAVIFHPIHEGRGDQSTTVPPDNYIAGLRWPGKFIEV